MSCGGIEVLLAAQHNCVWFDLRSARQNGLPAFEVDVGGRSRNPGSRAFSCFAACFDSVRHCLRACRDGAAAKAEAKTVKRVA